MIVNSNDNAAQVLWDHEGGSSAVGAFDRLAGMTDTEASTPTATGGCPPQRQPTSWRS